jgi:hypothetical protein
MPGAPLPAIYIAGASSSFIDFEFHSNNYGSWIRSGAAAQQPVAKDSFGGRLGSFRNNQVLRQLFSAFRPYGFASLVL